MMRHGINESALLAGVPLAEMEPFDTITMLTYWSRSLASIAKAADRYIKDGYNLVLHPAAYHLKEVEPLTFFSMDAKARCDYYLRRIHDLRYAVEKESLTTDVVNEPYHTGMLPEAADLYGAAAGMWRRRINEYGILEDAQFSRMWLDMLRESESLYEVIGIQAHVMARPDALPPMDVIRERLERYAALGKEIHISEVSVPSARFYWDEEQQAEWLEEFHGVCDSIPEVTLFGYWDLRDSEAWNKTSGLIREDGTKKPAYYRLLGMAGVPYKPEPEPVPWWRRIWRRIGI